MDFTLKILIRELFEILNFIYAPVSDCFPLLPFPLSPPGFVNTTMPETVAKAAHYGEERTPDPVFRLIQ